LLDIDRNRLYLLLVQMAADASVRGSPQSGPGGT
jgi:hypothetical protein